MYNLKRPRSFLISEYSNGFEVFLHGSRVGVVHAVSVFVYRWQALMVTHKANVVNELLEIYLRKFSIISTAVLSQPEPLLLFPPASPRLLTPSPSPPPNFYFQKLKEPLRGNTLRQFGWTRLECTVNGEVRWINLRCLDICIEALPRRWNSAIQSLGDYF